MNRKEQAENLKPSLEQWLYHIPLVIGAVTVSEDLPGDDVGFRVKVGSTESCAVRARGLPSQYGEFPVEYWNDRHPEGVARKGQQ